MRGLLAILLLLPALIVGAVAPWSFAGAELDSHEVSAGTTVVGEGAFAGSSVRTVTLPDGIEEIGAYAFSGCRNLEEINLPQGLRSIGRNAFAGCEALSQIRIPASVEEIGDEAFRRSGIGAFEPEEESRLRSIGAWSFYGCSDLERVVVPGSVESVGEGALFGCALLTDVDFRGVLTSMPLYMLVGDGGIEMLRLPSGLTEIGDGAMDSCTGLRALDVSGSRGVPSPGADVWHGIDQGRVILSVLEGLEAGYMADSQWGAFNIIGVSSSGEIVAVGDSPVSVTGSDGTLLIRSSCGLKQVRVYDVSGRAIHGRAMSGTETAVSIAGLRRGVLLVVTVTGDNKTVVTKISI